MRASSSNTTAPVSSAAPARINATSSRAMMWAARMDRRRNSTTPGPPCLANSGDLAKIEIERHNDPIFRTR